MTNGVFGRFMWFAASLLAALTMTRWTCKRARTIPNGR